jgi:uncharacterized membrane protein
MMAAVQRSHLLAQVPLFRGFSDEQRASLADRLVERPFAPGQPIFAKGDRGATMFIVLSGAVEIYLPPERAGGERVILKLVHAGDHFGELALFDEKPRSAGAVAREETLLLELTREAFVKDIVGSQEAVLAVLSEMADRLRDTNQLLTQRAARDAFKEIDENLSWGQRLADRVAELNGSWAFILCLIALSVVWALFNTWMARPFDSYPYVFFNLILALLVALQGPLIMMSQNRQAQKDRAQAAIDFRVNLKNEVGIESVFHEIRELRRKVEERLQALEAKEVATSRSDRVSYHT